MRRFALPLLLACFVTTPFACSTVEPEDDDDGGSKKKKSTPTYVGVPGITVRQVAMYQSLKRTLMVDGAPGAGEVPLVANRDAVIRVFYENDGTYDGSEVLARLEIEGFDPIEMTTVLGGPSVDEDINSTVNFVVPADHVGQTFNYAVSFLVEGKSSDDNAAARWPAEGLDSVAVEGPPNKLRIILAPFEYNFDGSGRVPDMSAEAVERYRQRLRQIYPVSDVEVTVRETTPWSQYIGPDGDGWQQVGYRVFGFRDQDNAPDDVYYYGIFNPAASINQYCGGGCLLGVTLLNDMPPATGSVELRLALGVGFDGYAEDTMAHEIGHSHGREHAPCGNPGGPDPQYPHDGGKIGIWGLDTATLELVDPNDYTDIMGYCQKQWVSDYTYKAFLNRGQNVNQPKMGGSTRINAALVGIDGVGNASWAGESMVSDAVRGRELPASFVDGSGKHRQTTAHYFGYDHLPGGLAVVPGVTPESSRVEIELDGKRVAAQR